MTPEQTKEFTDAIIKLADASIEWERASRAPISLREVRLDRARKDLKEKAIRLRQLGW